MVKKYKKNNKFVLRPTEEINGLKTKINYLEVIKNKLKTGDISFEEAVAYNINLFHARCRFINLFYDNKNKFKKVGFYKADLINLLNY